MGTNWIRPVRRSVGLVWVALMVLLVSFVALINLAPSTGRTLFIISGASMEPGIPLGALVAVHPVEPATIVAGDVVTVRADNGVIITHRVVRVVVAGDQRLFELRGDANENADPALIPGHAIVGRLDFFVPVAGYLLAFFSMRLGLLAVIGVLGSLLVAHRLLEKLEPPAARTPGARVETSPDPEAA